MAKTIKKTKTQTKYLKHSTYANQLADLSRPICPCFNIVQKAVDPPSPTPFVIKHLVETFFLADFVKAHKRLLHQNKV